MKTFIRWLGIGTVWLSGPSLAAGPLPDLTPARYFDCQLATRQSSLAGMQERQTLQQKRAGPEQLESAAATNRGRVELAFYRCGHSPSALAAYAHRYHEELKTWLVLNPQTNARIQDAGRRADAQVRQMGDNPRQAAR